MTALPTTFPRVPLKDMDPSMLVFELDRESERVMPEANEMITSAATVASFLHRNQTRSVRGDLPRVPYVEHPLRVALRLIRWGVTDGEVVVAALLHDVLEDCSEELLEVFGTGPETGVKCLSRMYTPRVAALVEALSNPTDGTSYAQHVEAIARTNPVALLVKASDLKDNAGSIPHQMGHGDEAKMLRRARKYEPVLPVVAHELDRRRIGELALPFTIAAEQITTLHEVLAALLAEREKSTD